MADCQIEKDDRALILHLSGDLAIDYADQLRSILIRSLRVAGRVEIDVASVTGVDISCLQLFCAAHKTAADMNKSVAFLDVSSGFQQMARQAGFTRSTGCMADKGIACIWKEERDHE